MSKQSGNVNVAKRPAGAKYAKDAKSGGRKVDGVIIAPRPMAAKVEKGIRAAETMTDDMYACIAFCIEHNTKAKRPGAINAQFAEWAWTFWDTDPTSVNGRHAALARVYKTQLVGKSGLLSRLNSLGGSNGWGSPIETALKKTDTLAGLMKYKKKTGGSGTPRESASSQTSKQGAKVAGVILPMRSVMEEALPEEARNTLAEVLVMLESHKELSKIVNRVGTQEAPHDTVDGIDDAFTALLSAAYVLHMKDTENAGKGKKVKPPIKITKRSRKKTA